MADTAGAHPLLLHLEPPPDAPSSSRLPASPREAPLSERLLRLWTERGDFSKFSLDQLDDEVDESASGAEGKVSDGLTIGWGPDGEEAYGKLAAEQDHKGKAKEVDTSPMTMEEFVQLKEDMMGRLQIAQQSLYSSQALVSLLVASHKSKAAQQNLALDSASVAATRPGSIAASRAESPAPSNASVGASGEKRHPAGSAAAVEAEFGLDPYSIALTSIERLDIKNETSQQAGQSAEEGTSGGNTQSRRKTITLPEFEHEAERDEYTEGRRVALAHKRQSMARAIDILRAGAQRLSGETTAAEVLQEGLAGEVEPAPASSKRSATSSAQRWRALRQAQSNGWGITPGRPGRSAFGARMRLDEGEQDAWIGFAIPESKPHYRRTALAYLRRDMPAEAADKAGKTKTDADLLVFTSRLKRRLRVAFVFQSGELKGEEVRIVSKPLQAHQGDGSSETIDESLRSAQAELADRELFDEVVAEARILSAQGAVTSLNTDESVTFNIGSNMRLIFEMVDTSATETEIDGEGDETSPSIVEAGAGEMKSESSALLSLVIAYLKLSLVKRYQARADALLAKETKPTTSTRPITAGGGAVTANKGDAIDANGPMKTKVAPAVADASTKPTAAAPVDPWEQASFLLPLLALLHYLSFTSQVRQVLSSHRGASQQQASVTYSFDAFESLPSPARWMHAFLNGAPKEVKGAMRSLSGSGAIFSSEKGENGERTVLLGLTCRYPDELSAHLPLRRRVDGALGVTLSRIGLGDLRDIVREIEIGKGK